MVALVDSSTRIRCLPVQPFKPIAASQGVCVGVPSVSPLVQRELLRAMREHLPQAYTNAWFEIGVTVSQTQELIDRRIEIISAARAIKVARMIASEPNAREVFGEAGRKVLAELGLRSSRSFRTAVRSLPACLRLPLSLSWVRRMAHNFAGSVNHIAVEKDAGALMVSIRRGVFSDRPDTLSGAQEYYRSVLAEMFKELAHMDCEVKEIKGPRIHLDQCHYRIVWET